MLEERKRFLYLATLKTKLSHLDTFALSLERCLSTEAFIPTFYCSFLETSEEVRQKFALTKFEVQEKRLAQSLRTLAGVMKGDRLALAHLNARAESHDRRHLNIKPELYVLWKATLLATASQFDRDWTPYVRESWESILDSAIQFMTKRYEVD